MKSYLVAFLGGGIGASARYWLSGAVYRLLSPDFPYGNLVVNVLGCFLIGFVMALFDDRFVVAPSLRIFLTIGILGGFTTFSSFSYETISLLRDRELFLGIVNVIATVFLCLAATYAGMTAGKLL